MDPHGSVSVLALHRSVQMDVSGSALKPKQFPVVLTYSTGHQDVNSCFLCDVSGYQEIPLQLHGEVNQDLQLDNSEHKVSTVPYMLSLLQMLSVV
jgi:hypothetical protein